MITAEIKMGNEYTTCVSGSSIEEVMLKIKDFHTMTPFMVEHFKKKGRLRSELESGWYVKETK